MQLPKIKSYNHTQPANSFFVLCKGENSGKPLREPCPNCFTVTCSSVDDYNYWFWLSWGLWKSKAFHFYLRGSVIPFVRICDYGQAIEKASAQTADRLQLKQAVDAMQNIEAREASIRQQLALLSQLKIAVFRKIVG